MNEDKFVYRQESLDGGWTIIHVLRGPSVMGRITKNPRNGAFRFFPGEDNSLAYRYEHRDLRRLKQLIETMDGAAPTPMT